MVKQGELTIIRKVSDDKFEGQHPNGINEGYTTFGYLLKDITVGERCIVYFTNTQYLNTSKVTEIIDENTFKTENSTYKIQPFILDDNMNG